MKSSVSYPIVPKTTLELKPGAFWGIPLESGRFGCGVVLDVKAGSRTSLLVGLTDYLGSELPREASLKECKLVAQGQVHLKSILLNGRTILGCVDLVAYRMTPVLMRDSNDLVNGWVLDGYRRVRSQSRSDQDLSVLSTWGFMVIGTLANKLDKDRSSR